VPITKGVDGQTNGLNPKKTALLPDILESNLDKDSIKICSGTPRRFGPKLFSVKSHSKRENIHERAARQAAEYCERIAAREAANPSEIDGRDAYSYLVQAIAYLQYVSGSRLRPHRDGKADAGDLAAINVLQRALTTAGREPMRIAVPVLNASPSPSLAELELRKLSAVALIAELQALRPELTSKKTLLGFTRAKLARMVIEARAAAEAADVCERRA
jgi:hypothetical protein